MEKERNSRRVEKQYEIRMYGLLVIVLVAVFTALAIGGWIGNKIGGSLDHVEVETPNYCSFDKIDGRIVVSCNELNIDANDLCKVTSSGIRDNLKVVVVSQSS